MVFLDTHVVVWLAAGISEKISPSARILLEDEILNISPMVMLELDYLHEIGKIRQNAESVYRFLQEKMDLSIADVLFMKLAQSARDCVWTRDPFDRVITAHAKLESACLLTSDKTILTHYPKAVW